MSDAKSTAIIQLSKGRKLLVQIGATCLTVSVACYGLALSTLITPILEALDAMGYVGVFSIFAAIGVTIMTPIGGKLGDIFGRKAIVVIAGIACILCGIGTAYATNLPFLMVCRFGMGIAQGAFVAAPYVIMGVVNEKKDVPKAMGYLAMALAIGGFGGSIIAGILTDLGMLKAAILFPAIPLALGITLIGLLYPNDKSAGKVKIDTVGILLLVIALFGILLPLNGSALGLNNIICIAIFVVGIVGTAALLMYEGKQEHPVIPVKLFREKKYMAFVLVSFICYFYRGAMDVYAALGAINVIGVSTSVTGTLQLPRTIVTMVLPAAAGVWVVKKSSNMWKAMAVATALSAFPMLAMGFTAQNTSFIIVYFVAITITGIAESCRGVSITPAAQRCLKPEDMGVGTSLITFGNTLSSSLAAAIYGAIYGAFTNPDPTNVDLMQKGINTVFLTAGAVMLAGLLLVLFVIRPMLEKEAAAQ